MFNFFEELFAPGRKHTSEEQKRLELSRVDLGVGDPGRGPIDLSSGKVTVRAPEPAAPDGEVPDGKAPGAKVPGDGATGGAVAHDGVQDDGATGAAAADPAAPDGRP
ncbi:DUF6191 domain-containing protein [Streptomyces sp. BE308]|uniref:DUF6191 domain-containing protein n=1 Tax=Streptomyces sp. BE308 TaxID=3002529 RepID=UPI002E77EE62|nr:DUF6191 domain-containing protein [Streptomyces sp. BE308]MEE1789964.1 DUF6191 domain-containing protein [Streptomyces sp. BE308]